MFILLDEINGMYVVFLLEFLYLLYQKINFAFLLTWIKDGIKKVWGRVLTSISFQTMWC